MTQQEELRVVLRTIADTNGATQVRRALGDVQAQAQRTSGGIVLKTVADTRGADQVRRSLADVRAQSQAHPPTVLRMTADTRGADQVRRELAYVRQEAQRAAGGIALKTVADTRGADQVRRVLTDLQRNAPYTLGLSLNARGVDQVRRSLVDVQTQAQRLAAGGIPLKTVADTRGADQIRRSLVDVQTQAQRTSGPGGIVLRTVAQTQGADQVRRSLTHVQQEAQRTGATASGIGRGFDLSTGSVLRFAGALTGLNIGLSVFTSIGQAIRGSITNSSEAFIDSQRIARATAAAYGQAASSFTNFATVLSAQTGFTKTAILEAALSARTLSDNYGLTIQQTQKLISVSADLAQVRGIGVAEAFERVQSAIRGEAEASEFLGLTLNATFLQQNAQNGALRQTFTTLTDAARAQVVYGEVLRQTANFTGLAAEGNKGLEGAQRQAALATQEFSQDLGKLLSPALERGTRQLTDMTRAAQELVNALRPKPPEPERQVVRPTAPSIAIPSAPFQRQELIDISKAVDAIPGIPRVTVQNAEDLRKAMNEITKLAFPTAVAKEQTLPGIFDAASQAADLSVNRLLRDLDVLQDRGSALGALLSALGEGATTSDSRASLQAAQDLLKVQIAITAQLGVQETRRKLQEQTRVSDPRDAPGARAALAELALFDQLEAANRDLITLQGEQRDLQREQRDLAIQEAQATLDMLPQRQAIAALERQITDQVNQRLRLQQEAAHIAAEQRAAPAQNALEDTQSAVARARLVLADRRNQTPEDRLEARQTIRGARNTLPGQELAAFDANQGIRGVERAQRATDLSTRAAQNPLQQRQVALQAAIRGPEANLAVLQQQSDYLNQLAIIGSAAIDRQSEIRDAIIAAAVAAAARAKEPVQVHIVVKSDDGVTLVDELIEANGAAQTPPVIQLSGVRR